MYESISHQVNFKTIAQGAATQVMVATSPSLADVNGRYFADCKEEAPTDNALDDAMADRLWIVTTELVASIA